MLNRIIHKQIEDLKFKDKQQSIEVLVSEGLILTNVETLEFTESYNFTTHSGENRSKIFKTLMNGSVSFDYEKNTIRWVLNLNGLLVKFGFTFIICALVWQFLLFGIWMNSLLIGGFVAILILWINWVRLNNRLDRLTNKMTIING